jgi:iron complex outermembrane receptor protein
MVENGGSLVIAAFPTPFGTQTFNLQGNPEFDVETLIAYEGGYRWQVRRNLALDLAAYYNDYDDIYSTVVATNPRQPGLKFANVKEGEGYGLEVAASWQAATWLNLAATYTYQRLELEATQLSTNFSVSGSTAGLPEDDFNELNNPRHQASIRSAIDFARDWQFNAWLRYVDEIKGRNNVDLTTPVTVDAYFLLDANIIWKPKKDLEIMFAGQNLLNSSQLEYVAELITPATEIERGFYAKLTWCF